MIILPAIDIREGKCVRLYKGIFEKSEIVAESPVKTAKSFEEAGAEYIHVVDLDGALKGEVVNIKAVKNIVKNVKVPIELGGGVRTIETIDKLIEIGVKRVILGTAALNDKIFVKEAVRKYDDKIAVGIDAKDGFVAVNGWLDISKVNYIEFAKLMEYIGVKNIILTDISKDGTLEGPNFSMLQRLKESVKCNITASGGIKSIDDILKLNDMNLYGTIVGKAIYSGNVNLKKAIKRSRD
ncbi:1-(5-phosphoribosyl)-5-[(5-phosphoribosylamino)methylideneamino]imidazole-4-carboxamide isomerase [Clostridium neuense]|uniref:1-(5-phosphoribosyl)-5-[(5-phosphoribosylamino)methylideneamino] imidazole-4-carboxamide isomerase n=1 Tax=Clostridium neuense TaxID=1728934 RepID=A0ABW8TF45_9CLOT